MTIRFAAARHEDSSVQRVLGAATRPAANDNAGEDPRGSGSDLMLRAALRHFAAHGLGAAEAARANAERAFFADNRGEYRWWLGICRMLDRRMADAAAIQRSAARQG